MSGDERETRPASVPTDFMIARAASLLARGGVAASAGLVLLVAVAWALVAVGMAVQDHGRSPGTVLGVLLVLAGAFTLPVAIFAGPLGAFASVVHGARGVRAPLLAAFSAFPSLFAGVYLVIFSSGSVFLVSALLLVFGVQSGTLLAKAPFAIVALLGMLLGVWVHGVMLIEIASVAVRGWMSWVHVRIGKGQALLVGGLPLAVVAAFSGGQVVRDRGLAVAPVPADALAVVGVVAVALAHVVSCALAVALASPSESEP